MVNSELVEVPNLFNFVGRHGLMVELQLNGVDGKPSLSYHDEFEAKEFHGGDVVHDSSALGELYTVSVRTVAQVGETKFTLVVPPVNLAGAHYVETVGIRTMRRFSNRITEGGAVMGQAESYRTCRLWGTASQVESLAPAATGH